MKFKLKDRSLIDDVTEIETVSFREIVDNKKVANRIAPESWLQQFRWFLLSELQWFLKRVNKGR